MFWRYWNWNEIPKVDGAYEEIEYELGNLLLEHWSNQLFDDYEANAKAKETVDGEEGLEDEGGEEADIEEEKNGDEEEDAEEDDEPWEEDREKEEDDENGAKE